MVSIYLANLSIWKREYDISHYNLSELIPHNYLVVIQILAIAGGVLWVLKEKQSISGFFKILLIVIGIFLLASIYNPHYFSFIFLTMIYLYEVFSIKEQNTLQT